MRKLMLAATLALALGGCATPFGQKVEAIYQVVTSTTVSPTTVIVAANSFNALEATATNYLKLAKCNGSNGPFCRDTKATAAIIPAIRSGRVARTNLEQFLRDHPDELGPSGLYDALTKSIDTLQTIFTHYNVGAAK